MNNPKLSLIAAISENHVLAKNGKIPWKIPTDFKRYMDTIKGHVIIAGRKTFDPSYNNTVNIVVTRDIGYKPPIKALVANSIQTAIEKAKSKEILKQAEYTNEIFVIGGGEIFKETIGIANKLYLTVIHKEIEGDTFFPDYSLFKRVTYKEDRNENGYSFTFLNLERR